MVHANSFRVALSIPLLEDQSKAWAFTTGDQQSVLRLRRTLEQHRLDPGVIVEEFDVDQVGAGGAGMGVDGRRGMGGEGSVETSGDGRSRQEAGYAAAAGGIRLQHIDGARLEHGAEVPGRIAVLAGGYAH